VKYQTTGYFFPCDITCIIGSKKEIINNIYRPYITAFAGPLLMRHKKVLTYLLKYVTTHSIRSLLRRHPMTLTVSVKDEKADNIVTAAKVKAVKNKMPLSGVIIQLLEKWNKGEVQLNGSRNS